MKTQNHASPVQCGQGAKCLSPLLLCVGLLLPLAIALVGCAVQAPSPRWLMYTEPDVSRVPVAFLNGYTVPGNLLSPVRAFVFAVDGGRVENGRERGSVSVPILPGKRVISLQIGQGNAYARADLTLEAGAGKDYAIRVATDLGARGNSYCDFWIIDAKTNAVVTKAVRSYVIR